MSGIEIGVLMAGVACLGFFFMELFSRFAQFLRDREREQRDRLRKEVRLELQEQRRIAKMYPSRRGKKRDLRYNPLLVDEDFFIPHSN